MKTQTNFLKPTMHRIWAILFASLLAAGADHPLTLPEWLATPEEATSVSTTASSASVELTYLFKQIPTEVTSQYQKQFQKAGVQFKIGFDGIGNAISASKEGVSCIIHIVEADNGSRIRVSCVTEIVRPIRQAIVPSVQPPAVAAIPERAISKRPTSAKDVDGWLQARWGMTQEQVLRAFSGEARVLTDDSLDRNFG